MEKTGEKTYRVAKRSTTMSTGRKLRVGVIGAGFWGKNHVRVFSELGNVELAAVCDISARGETW